MTRSTRPDEPDTRPTVLAADDDVAVLALVRRMLGDQGYHVVTAAGGEEALEILATSDQRIDLLITDVFMPRLNGPELARRAKSENPELEVLFMSGSLATDLRELQSIQSAPFIAKPFSRKELLREVRSLLAPETESA